MVAGQQQQQIVCPGRLVTGSVLLDFAQCWMFRLVTARSSSGCLLLAQKSSLQRCSVQQDSSSSSSSYLNGQPGPLVID